MAMTSWSIRQDCRQRTRGCSGLDDANVGLPPAEMVVEPWTLIPPWKEELMAGAVSSHYRLWASARLICCCGFFGPLTSGLS